MKAKKPDKIFLLALFASVGIILALFSTMLAVNIDRALWWDESIYLLLSRSIASAGETGYFEDFRPVLWSFFLIPVLFVRQISNTMSVITLAINALNLYMVYRVFRKFVNKKALLISLPFIAAFSSVLQISIIGISEHIAIFFCLLALGLYFDGKKTLAVAVAGLAFLARFPFGLVFFGIMLTELILKAKQLTSPKKFWETASKLLLYAAVFMAVVSPYLLFMQFSRGSFMYPFQQAVYVVNVSGLAHNEPVWFYFVELLKRLPFLLLMPLSAAMLWKKGKKRETLAITAIALSMLLYFSFSVDFKELRYINPFVFLAVPFSLSCLGWLAKKRKQKPEEKKKKQLLIAIAGILLLANFAYLAHDSSYLLRGGYVKDYFIEFSQLVPPEEEEIITTDPTIAVYVNAVIVPYKPNSDIQHLAEKSSAGYFYYNSCNMICPVGYDDECKVEALRLSEFVEGKEIIHKKQVWDCQIKLYRIR